MKAKQFIVATNSNNYVSSIYLLNGFDFETSTQLNAQVFESESEAQEFISKEEESGTAVGYLFVLTKTDFSKEEFEIFEYSSGYFGICEKNKHGGSCVYGGDSACEDHYNRELMEDIFDQWDGDLNWTGETYGYRIEA